jgi:hypothetical protein
MIAGQERNTLSVAPGEAVTFYMSSAGAAGATSRCTIDIGQFAFAADDLGTVDAATIKNSAELTFVPKAASHMHDVPDNVTTHSHPSDKSCEDWVMPYTFTVPQDWESGIYAARCVDPDSSQCYIVFIVRPKLTNRNKFLLLANVNTWNAYNPWGNGSQFSGFSRYTNPPVSTDPPNPFTLSYVRPNPVAINLGIKDSDETSDTAARNTSWNSRHLARGELWVLSWLRRAGYSVDVYSDLDWHFGVDGAIDYDAVILSTHPEYWSTSMYNNRKLYLDLGGSLIYLGGNAIFEAVEIDAAGKSMKVYGQSSGINERRNKFRDLGLYERELLGIRYLEPNVGWTATFNPYVVRAPAHRFFTGTNAVTGTLLGLKGWNFRPYSATAGLDQGCASGWETDSVDTEATLKTIVLAEDQDIASNNNRAQTVYGENEGGGFVFSVGSITFGGSLVIDKGLQRLVGNALDAARRRRATASSSSLTKAYAIGAGDVAQSPGGRVWVVRTNGTIWYSDDLGVGFARTDAAGFSRAAAAADETLWAVGFNGTLWSRVPANGAWQRTGAANLCDVAVSQAGRIWVAGTDATIRYSDNAGSTFTQIHASGFHRVAVAPDGTLWAVGLNGTLWYLPHSQSYPQTITTWVQTVASGMGDVAVSPAGRVWVAGTNGTIWYSDDAGATWTQINASGFGQIATGPAGRVWAAGFDGTLWGGTLLS